MSIRAAACLSAATPPTDHSTHARMLHSNRRAGGIDAPADRGMHRGEVGELVERQGGQPVFTRQDFCFAAANLELSRRLTVAINSIAAPCETMSLLCSPKCRHRSTGTSIPPVPSSASPLAGTCCWA